jgi:hypothetical protein
VGGRQDRLKRARRLGTHSARSHLQPRPSKSSSPRIPFMTSFETSTASETAAAHTAPRHDEPPPRSDAPRPAGYSGRSRGSQHAPRLILPTGRRRGGSVALAVTEKVRRRLGIIHGPLPRHPADSGRAGRSTPAASMPAA